MILTPAGDRLLPYATQVARLLTDAEQAVLSDGTPRGALRLGCMETTAALRMPKVLTAYASCYPEIDIQLELGPTESLIAGVLTGGSKPRSSPDPINQKHLIAVPVFNEELVLVAEAKLKNQEEVLSALASKREARVLVFKTGCSYRPSP